MHNQPPPALTVAGSDSGGAAGLQADLKCFAALGVYGLCALTVVTAQDSERVVAIHALPPALVAAQIDAVLNDYGARAAKTGFLGRAALVEVVGARLAGARAGPLVVDPVLVNQRAEAMFPTAVVDAYRAHLLPRAALVTPNRHEAALLLGGPVTDLAAGRAAARALRALGPAHVLLKRLPDGDAVVDLYFDGRELRELRAPALHTANTHGSGDTLSAAVVAYLARGATMGDAVRRAHAFTQRAIAAAAAWRLGRGHGPVDPLWACGGEGETGDRPS